MSDGCRGEACFDEFGITGCDVPADDALEQMLSDKHISVIHAFTDLNFVKRHEITRSDIVLDFHGHRVLTVGIEPAMHNDPFSAVFHFIGRDIGDVCSCVISEPLKEMYDVFEVPDSSRFPVYSWWVVSANALAGREEKEIDKLLQVTEIIDESHVRFNYKMGWELEAGRSLTFKRMEPVSGVTVRNMKFYGNAGGEECGAHPVAMEFAVDCDVINVHAFHTYWPVVLRRHNTRYVTEKCSLINPTEVVVGGTGYLTQQIHCLYGKVRDCTASNARHLNDFTGSAYCMVENCHCDGDFHGAFVTHGQFEHDLTYIGNSGLLSFANSGPTWGSSAKRIHVSRHAGCWGIAFAKVSDLTLVDVDIRKTEKYEDCGTLLMNADGLQLQGCRADKLILTQRSARSLRPNVIANCVFPEGVEIIKEGEAAVHSEISFVNTVMNSDTDSEEKGRENP